MKHLSFFLVIFTAQIAWLSCNQKLNSDPLSHISDQKVKEVLERGLLAAGGIENYRAIDSVMYQKRTVLYLADGQVESETNQLHQYKLLPEPSGSIKWQDSLGKHEIFYSKDFSYKSLNGDKIEGSGDAAAQSFFSSYYVLFLPFKLMDEGATLTYEGITDFGDGQKAEVIKATYNPDQYNNHSTSDEWFLYFDPEDGRVLGNLVYHPPTYAFIENSKTTDDYPLRMNLYRQTWRTDEARNKEYLRGEFWYTNYKFTSFR